MENIEKCILDNKSYKAKNIDEKSKYQKEKYRIYNSNKNLKLWLNEHIYECEICNKIMHYMSRNRHMRTKIYVKNIENNDIKNEMYE